MGLRDWLRRSPRKSEAELQAEALERTVSGGTWTSLIGGFGAGARPAEWFQTDQFVVPRDGSAAVYACTAVIAQELSRLPIVHERKTAGGAWEPVENSGPERVLAWPNQYQTTSDFILYLQAGEILEGNSIAFARRDGSNRIAELHPRPWSEVSIRVDPQSGLIGFECSANALYPDLPRVSLPSDVLHLKAMTGPDPLIGMTPLQSAAVSIHHGMQINRESLDYWANRQPMSGYFTTDAELDDSVARRIMARWKEAKAGEKVVLDRGMKFFDLKLSARDAQMIEQYGLTVKDVCSVMRVPLWMVGHYDQSMTFSNVEAMGHRFVQQTLGFWINHTEQRLNRLFGLPRNRERLRMDMDEALLRASMKERYEAYAAGVRGGFLTPNEPRRREGLPDKQGGNTIFLQQQMEPIQVRAASSASSVAPAPNPAQPSAPPGASSTEDSERASTERHAVELAKVRMEHSAEVGALRARIAELERISQ